MLGFAHKILATFALLALVATGTLAKTGDRSDRIEGFTRSAFEKSLSQRPLHDIEGIWMWTDESIIIGIERYASPDRPSTDQALDYRMIMIQSPNRGILPGTIIGYAHPTAKTGEYEARIYTGIKGTIPIIPQKFTLEIDRESNRLLFNKHRSRFRLNPSVFLPYVFRYSLWINQQRKSNNGCIRVYPPAMPPLQPVYL